MKIAKVFIFSLIFISSLVFPPISHSQDFPPNPIECNSKADNEEYHSLRPYPFSPCNAEVTGAIICGNTVYVHDSITVRSCCRVNQCCTCHYSVDRKGNVTIDFSDSEPPIVGNTEDVTNWDTQTDTLTDAQKVNEYVSWYLNGVINRAEYPPLDVNKNCIGETTQRAGVCLNTDALGLCLSPNPVLIPPTLPNPLLNADGTISCGGGKKSCCVTKNPLARKVDILDRDKLINYSGPINKLLPQEVQQQERAQTVKNVTEAQDIRHNQIVGCTYGINILGLEIGGIPGPCYEKGLLSLLPHQRHYLREWADHLPPVRSDPRFNNYTDYYVEYQRWRGKDCKVLEIPDSLPIIGNIPIIGGMGILLCYDDIGNPNFYSALYPYIPLSSTEDRVGAAKKEVPTEINMGNLVLTDIIYDAGDPELGGIKLYYAHMEETASLSGLLKKTFVPKEGAGGEGETTPVAIGTDCRILDVRTNPGDHLVDPGWDLNKRAITGDLSYTANFSCSFCGPGGSCTVNPVIPISLSTQNPLHDELWHNLVEGADSIFRRIFPKVGQGTSLDAPKDIPGVTTFKYYSTDNYYTIKSGGEIYFPHLGGISEYFLKGIQTMLRPKGYGDLGSTTGTTTPPGDICGVASKYNIPCCQLQGIEELETGSGTNMGNEPCQTKNGVFSCCHGKYCGFVGIACAQYDALVGNDNIDMCTAAGSAELLARAMLLKLCQADSNLGNISSDICTSYDWATWGDYVLQHYSVSGGDYTAAAYFYGLANGCTITACSQFRWGAGKGYCDAVKAYCETGSILPDATDGSFCEKCNEEVVRAGQQAIDCSQY